MVFKVIVHEDKDGLWAEVPSIKGCFSQGETMEELENNIKEGDKKETFYNEKSKNR